jgi:hypothetical protein
LVRKSRFFLIATVKPKLTFLPIFFVTLAAALAVAVALRVHAYMEGGATSTIQAEERARAGSARSDASYATHDVTAADPGTVAAAAPPRVVEETPPFDGTSAGSYGSVAARRAALQERQRRLLSEPLQPVADAPPATTRPAAPAPKPVPPPVPKPPEKSTVAKILDPIKKFFSEEAPKAQPTTTEETRKPEKEKEKDPTSDSTAPKLIAITFNPPVVHDGEESLVQVVANDDISGIRSISASVASPAGKALRAFPFQKDPETDIWTGRVQVPKDAEEGVWHINFLSMTDNANNTANLTYANGSIPPTATLRVLSSGSDSQAPVLRNVWMDKRAISEGEHNTVFVQADDDKSGVALISGVFQSPKKNARIGFGCRPAGEGQAWACDVSLPKCVDCGEWTLEQIQLQDKANNQGTVRNNDPLIAKVSFNIAGQSCDSQPPTLVSLTLDPVVVSNAAQSVIHVTAVITDDTCGVASASGQAGGPAPATAGEQPPKIYFPLTPVPDQPNTFAGNIVVPPYSAKGVWHIIWVQAVDKANNIRPYGQNEAPLPAVTFKVE